MERISLYTADLQQGDVIVRGAQGFPCEFEVEAIVPFEREFSYGTVQGSEVIGWTPENVRESIYLVPQSRLRVVRP
jgi:hypothetical protein